MANQISPGRLERMPLTAVLGIAFNGFSAVIFTVLAVLATIQVDVIAFKIGDVEIRHGLWVIMIGIAVWATGTVASRWIQATHIFVQRLRRDPVRADARPCAYALQRFGAVQFGRVPLLLRGECLFHEAPTGR